MSHHRRNLPGNKSNAQKHTQLKPQSDSLIPVEHIASQIYLIRGRKVMLDTDLATLYGVPTKALNQAVTRNRLRFPADFMFRLSREELDNWRSQFVTSNPSAKMGLRRPPRVFTHEGVAMLSSVLRSDRAAEANVAIMRTFVRLRKVLASHEELTRKIAQHDREITVLFDQVKGLLEPPNPRQRPSIGFAPPRD